MCIFLRLGYNNNWYHKQFCHFIILKQFLLSVQVVNKWPPIKWKLGIMHAKKVFYCQKTGVTGVQPMNSLNLGLFKNEFHQDNHLYDIALSLDEVKISIVIDY